MDNQSPLKITPPRTPTLNLIDLDVITASAVRPDTLIDYATLVGADLAGRDLYELRVQDCEWDYVDLSEAQLVNARISDTRFQNLTATTLRAPKAEFRNAEFLSSRIGAADLASAQFRNVAFTGCKLGYVNLRDAKIVDVRFDDCAIDELDLAGATLERVAFGTSQARTISINFESAKDFDLRTLAVEKLENIRSLRGVIIDDAQLMQFAATFAERLDAHVAS
jgi:uncharacterized protein YjbI with pentapeptide repeats